MGEDDTDNQYQIANRGWLPLIHDLKHFVRRRGYRVTELFGKPTVAVYALFSPDC